MKKNILIIGILTVSLILFGCKSKKQGDSNINRTDETYNELRKSVFNVTPDKIGLKRESSGQVWGFVMETRYPKGIYTLIAFADGSASLYFSTGGGYIGLGQKEEIQKIIQILLSTSENYISSFTLSSTYALPEPGMTSMYLFTWDGTLTASENEKILTEGQSNLSPLFFQAHSLISAARVLDEKKGEK